MYYRNNIAPIELNDGTQFMYEAALIEERIIREAAGENNGTKLQKAKVAIAKVVEFLKKIFVNAIAALQKFFNPMKLVAKRLRSQVEKSKKASSQPTDAIVKTKYTPFEKSYFDNLSADIKGFINSFQTLFDMKVENFKDYTEVNEKAVKNAMLKNMHLATYDRINYLLKIGLKPENDEQKEVLTNTLVAFHVNDNNNIDTWYFDSGIKTDKVRMHPITYEHAISMINFIENSPNYLYGIRKAYRNCMQKLNTQFDRINSKGNAEGYNRVLKVQMAVCKDALSFFIRMIKSAVSNAIVSVDNYLEVINPNHKKHPVIQKEPHIIEKEPE